MDDVGGKIAVSLFWLYWGFLFRIIVFLSRDFLKRHPIQSILLVFIWFASPCLPPLAWKSSTVRDGV